MKEDGTPPGNHTSQVWSGFPSVTFAAPAGKSLTVSVTCSYWEQCVWGPPRHIPFLPFTLVIHNYLFIPSPPPPSPSPPRPPSPPSPSPPLPPPSQVNLEVNNPVSGENLVRDPIMFQSAQYFKSLYSSVYRFKSATAASYTATLVSTKHFFAYGQTPFKNFSPASPDAYNHSHLNLE